MKNWIACLAVVFATVEAHGFTLLDLFAVGPKGRGFLGYGLGNVDKDNLKPDTISEFDRTQNFHLEVETDTLLALTFGMRFGYDRNTQINFADAGLRRGEIYLSTVQLGLKINIFWLYLGGGVMGGWLAVSDPENRPTQGFGVPWSRETSGIRGIYLNGGLNLWLAKDFGFRVGYQHDIIETNRYTNLARKGVDFNQGVGMVGLIFGGSGGGGGKD